jgi:hypothetical protein
MTLKYAFSKTQAKRYIHTSKFHPVFTFSYKEVITSLKFEKNVLFLLNRIHYRTEPKSLLYQYCGNNEWYRISTDKDII